MATNKTVRRPIANVSIWGTTFIHKRDPTIIACWSLAFPGFGHILLHKYTRGFALIIWEVFINQSTRLNEAMVYSFLGNIEMAKAVLNPNTVFMYIPIYFFSIWDSHRTTIGMNNLQILAEAEKGNPEIPALIIKPFEINYLDKRRPLVALAWSMALPSLGQLYLHQIFSAIFTLVMIIVFNYYSHFVEGIYYLFQGNIDKSTEVLDKQWLMYMPSLYLFSMFESYMNTVEYNKLHQVEQRHFLIENFQPKRFKVKKGIKVK
ncbi:MAG: hypothetical protein ABF649_10455 [Bacillus sp. (in: firmicutes)]